MKYGFMYISMYERYGEHEKHRENIIVMILGFKRRREIK